MQTIGEWYRDNVLHRDDLIEVEMPYSPGGEPHIVPELFCWRLYHGKKYIECSTEMRARYLKAFMDARVNRIRMPQDEEYLKKVVPQLEEVIADTVDWLTFRTDGILNISRREKLLDLVWYKMMREGWEAEEQLFPYMANESDGDEEEINEEENEKEVEEDQIDKKS